MAHMIEHRAGKASMAYAGEVPWHGLGTRVPADLTPDQMLEAANLNWTVRKLRASVRVGHDSRRIYVGRSALLRDCDDELLSVVSDDWNPVQNHEAFAFFNDFIAAGDMEMHTAGSLCGGQIVWALAKVKESFTLFKGDQVDSYLLFTNFHRYGFSTDIRFTPVRVVCNNTLSVSLSAKLANMAKFNHTKAFDPEIAKAALGFTHDQLAKYKEQAAFLGSKQYTNETVVEYFKRIFPLSGSTQKKEMSKNATLAMDVLDKQPGADFAPGTWWNAYNAVTYLTDHVIGHNANNRINSAWYGDGKKRKEDALTEAMDFAKVA